MGLSDLVKKYGIKKHTTLYLTIASIIVTAGSIAHYHANKAQFKEDSEKADRTKLIELTGRYQLANIVAAEEASLRMNPTAIMQYNSLVESIRKDMRDSVDKKLSDEEKLRIMRETLVKKGYDLSNAGTGRAFLLHAGLYKKTLDCNKLAMLIGTIAESDFKMNISPVLYITPNGTINHVVLLYGNEGKYDPLYGQNTSVAIFARNTGYLESEITEVKLERNGYRSLAWNGIGTYYLARYLQKSDNEFARISDEAFQNALLLEKNNILANLNRAQLYVVTGNWVKAIADFNIVLKFSTNSPEIELDLARTYVQAKDFIQARNLYKSALEKALHPRYTKLVPVIRKELRSLPD